MSDNTLDRIRERMGKHKAQTGSGDYWKPEPDSNHVLRILPPVGNMDAFWQQVGRHYMQGTKTTVICPDFTTDGAETCVLCERARALNRSNDAADKAEAKGLFVRRSYHMNVILRDESDEGYNGPSVYTPGVVVFENLYAIVADEDYGAIWDAEHGVDIKLKRIGSGLDTTYQVMPRPARTVLLDTSEAIDELLAGARDLSEVLGHLPTPDQMLEAAGLVVAEPEVAPEAEDDFPEDE